MPSLRIHGLKRDAKKSIIMIAYQMQLRPLVTSRPPRLEIENIPKRGSSQFDHWHGPAGPRRKDRSEPESKSVIYWNTDTN